MTTQYLDALKVFVDPDDVDDQQALGLIRQYTEEWERRLEQCRQTVSSARGLQKPFTEGTWQEVNAAWVEAYAIEDTWMELASHFKGTLGANIKKRFTEGKAGRLMAGIQDDYTTVKRWYEA